MEKLKRRYAILNRQINDCRSIINMIQAMNEDLIPRGRGYTEISNDEARNYLYCLDENLTIECFEVEKQIVQKILNLVENDMSLYTEFIPYKYPIDSTNLIYKTKYILCEYNCNYYLMSGSKNPKEEIYLLFIYNDLKEAINAFINECQSYIEIRKDIDARFDLTPEQQAKLEKIEYNNIPKYEEILKHFK